MKKYFLLLLSILATSPILATQKVTTSLIVASTLVLSNNKKYDKNLSLGLHKAIEQNNLTLAQKLINNPEVDINAKVDYGTNAWKKGWTPLNVCAVIGDDALQIAQALLKHQHINVNLQTNTGLAPLIKCAHIGDKALQIANALLKHKHINVNLQQENGWTPLIKCAHIGDKALHIAQALLKHKHINVNLQDKNGLPPLHWCSYTGDDALQIANALLKHQHINVNVKNNIGKTPLHVCSQTGDDALHIAQALLKHKHINVNLQTNDGATPLHWCSQTGDKALQIANALLTHNHINVNLQDNDGDTPLDNIVYWIKENKENYTYVKLWNMLVARGGILDKRKNDYNNLNPSDFQEPQKGYVQWIKNTPPINLAPFTKKLEQTIQNNNEQIQGLTNELATNKQTIQQQTQQIKTKDKESNRLKEEIQHYLIKIESLKDDANKVKDSFATFKQCIKQKAQNLKYETKKTITRLYRSQKNLEKARDELKNRLSTTMQKVEEQNKEKELLHKEIEKLKRNFDEELSLDCCDAIDGKDYTLAEELIKNPKVDINIQDDNGFTPLLWCCWNGDKALSIAKLLIEHPDIDVTAKDKYDKNALHIVCLKGALNILALLLKQPKVEQLLQEEDKDKKTPLDVLFDQITGEHYNMTYLSIWNTLVDKGARLNIRQKNYDNLNLNSFQEPQKTCVRLIKQNLPKNLKTNNKFMDEEETKEDE